MTTTHKRISKRKLEEYHRFLLSERDKAVLCSIQMCRYLKTDQVKRLHFGDSTTSSAALRSATRTLTKLYRLGLVQPLQRRIGGVRAGSTSYVWTLKTAGVELLRMAENPPTNEIKPSTQTRKREYEPTDIFPNHTLAVSELYTQLRTMTNNTTKTNTSRLMTVEFEPPCWRSYTTVLGINVTLKPDLYAITATDGYEDYWFFEVDLDTEAPVRIIQKCERYGRYYLTGKEQEQTGIFPKVVWIVPSQRRQNSLLRHIGDNLSEYINLFAVITFDELNSLICTGSGN